MKQANFPKHLQPTGPPRVLPVFKSSVFANSATTVQRQQRKKLQEELLMAEPAPSKITATGFSKQNLRVAASASSNMNGQSAHRSSIEFSQGINSNPINKVKNGEPLYEMQSVMSSAHVYREMRRNGQVTSMFEEELNATAANTAAKNAQANSKSPSSAWTSTFVLLAAGIAMAAWNYSSSGPIVPMIAETAPARSSEQHFGDVVSSGSVITTTSPSVFQGGVGAGAEFSAQPLWLQRPRS